MDAPDRKTGSGGLRRKNKAGRDALSPVLDGQAYDVTSKLKSTSVAGADGERASGSPSKDKR